MASPADSYAQWRRQQYVWMEMLARETELRREAERKNLYLHSVILAGLRAENARLKKELEELIG